MISFIPQQGKELSKEEIKKLIEENHVKFIRLQFVDINGMVKNLAVPAKQIDKILNNELMLDGSSIKGFRDIDNIFFDKMREEFSTLNKGNKEEYLTTQYLSLLAHHHGFDGIRFRSSLVEQGENYVIFDAMTCQPILSKMYVLKKVEYELFPIILPSEKELIK